ncbi:GFA family protein [Halomonas sp. wenzhen-202101]|uniref:GFA family protein n=1 Tax=Halomonas dongshanensis TaxID=2890835 RepID=A0ABT2EF98_9GAMM|nr:GFA family protein [Halomonas dongshanensis]
MALSGSCLCGGVQYEITGPLTDIYHCHCSMCRKLHAAVFRTCAKVQASDWQTVSGEGLPKSYESSPREFKVS